MPCLESIQVTAIYVDIWNQCRGLKTVQLTELESLIGIHDAYQMGVEDWEYHCQKSVSWTEISIAG